LGQFKTRCDERNVLIGADPEPAGWKLLAGIVIVLGTFHVSMLNPSMNARKRPRPKPEKQAPVPSSRS
jgi:hypothetical protein